MTAEEEQALLDALSIEIRAKAKAAFDELLARIRAGDSPQDALKAISASYQFAVEVALAHAFTQVMGEFVGVADIKALSIGGISLSDTLYRHLGETNKVALTIINDHLKGVLEAKKLALELFDGYSGTRVLPIKARLPKYLRAAMRDPALSHGFSQIFARAQASKLKTEALKISYLNAIDAVAAGAGQERLKKLLTFAYYERNRYLANRIAQTETHRAYSDRHAQEIMATEGMDWIQVRMSQRHPKFDICDRHANLDAYGKGRGVYPKALAPKPPFHPHCFCRLVERWDIEGTAYKHDPHAERRFMSTLTDDQQRQVAGGWAKLERFRGGESLTAIHDDGVRPEYRLQTVGGKGAFDQSVARKQYAPVSTMKAAIDWAESRYAESVSTTAHRVFGGVMQDGVKALEKMNVINAEFDRLQTQYPNLDLKLKTLHLTDDVTGRGHNRMAKGMAEMSVANEWDSSIFDSQDQWDAAYGRHWDWIRAESHTAYNVRHELGHVLTGYNKVIGFDGEQRWGKIFTKYQRKKKTADRSGAMVSWWKSSVTDYAATNADEAFAEAFAIYTSPHYGTELAKDYLLPKDITDILDQILMGTF